MKINRIIGQSLVEVVVAIGIMALVVTGVVMLMTTSLGTKSKGFDRNKAVEMSEVVMEQIIGEKTDHPDLFWDKSLAYWTGILGQTLTLPEYPGYDYTVQFKQNTDGSCGSGGFVCGEVVLNIGWSSSTDTAKFTRLFTRY